MSGIPIIQPVPLSNDPCGPMGSPQPILQFKELAVDQVRYQEWKASLKRLHKQSGTAENPKTECRNPK